LIGGGVESGEIESAVRRGASCPETQQHGGGQQRPIQGPAQRLGRRTYPTVVAFVGMASNPYLSSSF
jgi:hypothetical protein